MPMDKPKNNGYAVNIPENINTNSKEFYRPLFWFSVACVPLLLLISAGYGSALICTSNVALPFAAVASVNFWHGIINRGKDWFTHAVFCASVFGEIIGASVTVSYCCPSLIHISILGITGFILGNQKLTTGLFATCRLYLIASFPWMPYLIISILCHACILAGRISAKYVESHLTSQIAADLKLSTPRRRRTSNNTIYNIYKVRRTSLPALGGSNKSPHHGYGFQGSASTVDVALLAEAHGCWVTDMLADPNLPAHVVGGLRSLASLLSPPTPVSVNHRIQRPGGASVSLADFNSGSDNEEIPYTGEKPSALSKRFRRNLPPSLLRRMSTSTWTTTTSATGLPTLEPEPSRKRSTSFRHPTDSQNTSPRGGNSPQAGCAISPSRSQLVSMPTCSKGRSYSTTSIPSNSLSRRNSRDRKTVCSLHPLTSAEIEALHEAHAHREDELQLFQMRMELQGGGEADVETTEDDEEGSQPLPPLPCIRRVNISSDYESSNESPGSSDNNDVTLSDDRLPRSLAIQTVPSVAQDINRCTLCGGRTRRGVTIETGAGRSPNFEDTTPTGPDEDEEDSLGLLVNGYRYNLEVLDSDSLLNRINEWDYPIFDLKAQAQDLILSQMCYKIFREVGLFEAFKIPIQEFLNYFHALESGYREKPYHNRMHAADVLHGVYYLTSQPIPGFTQIPSDATDSPLHKTTDSGNSSMHRPSFAADVTYGVMGANYPALELMALYAAAAMHDYDHPGRTNAFLVSTYAPQAVLYNDRSVLENHHAAAAWNLFLSRPEYNFLCHLDKAEFKRFRFLVIECILATDLKRHFEILAEFNAKANEDDAPGIDWMSETDRLLAMEMCIKLSDINGPCKRHDIHVQWTYRIAEEFYEQGDEEADLGLQVSPFMDRKNPQLAKLQESFINHLVAPLCNAYGEAALLPGVWVEDSESGEDDESPDQVESSTVKFSDEIVDSDSSIPSVTTEGNRPVRNRKVSCLQAVHLRENYDHWVEILKREQLEYEKENPAEFADNELMHEEKQNPEDEMETIEEESALLRLTPTSMDQKF
ncbi:cGMP-inhibited 3',5'-cyclic phosphodiesterase 3A-like [Uloborus diversus]|uniref:cGMP-inhibited 3',5'-cyclic phosphodiesterase 3A-like n=1 Tax=Uloborus diversus TaxID=327109 RepID=UPI002408FE87|nr:cGMP-inhibited 3',5'-cyclic phosphodiesterase 3A-like [Uloborus diversus]